MRRLPFLLFFLLWYPAHAQTDIPTFQYVTTAPSGSCGTKTVPIQVVTSTGYAYSCNSGTWGPFNANGSGADGTVKSVGIGDSDGTSGNVTNATTTPVIYISLGDITPNSVNGYLSPPVSSQSGSAPVYYVDNNQGSNANAGTSPDAPWNSIAWVNAQTFSAGSQVLFLSDDVWHEQLVAQAGVTYSWYGAQRSCTLNAQFVASCNHMPIIDGADAVGMTADPAEPWTLVTGTTWKITYTPTASKGFVDATYSQTTPLALQANLAAVEANLGSIWSDGAFVYVNLFDGSDPDNHNIEVSGQRAYGVDLGGLGNIAIDGLEIIRAAKSGIVAGVQAVGPNVILRNNVLFNSGDSLGDSAQGGGSGEGTIYAQVATSASAQTGWQVLNNWVGQSDIPDSTVNLALGGIVTQGLSGEVIRGNKVATVHGAAIQVSDASATTCTTPDVEGNEVVASEGNVNFYGCQNAIAVGNSIHDSAGTGIQIGGGYVSGDQANVNPYFAGNVIHDLAPAYTNTQYNGIWVNSATGGVAVGNSIYRVSAGEIALDAVSTASSGWQVYGNTLDATENTSYLGTAPTGSSAAAYPMYVRSASLSGLTMRANTFGFNPITPVIRFGATSGSDFSHDLSQTTFDASFPGDEIGGAIGNFTSLAATSITDSGLSSGNCVQASTGGLLATTGSPCGTSGSSGFPITIGSTSIGSGSTTTTIAGLHLTTSTINGVTPSASGSSTLFLNQAGGYTAPAGTGTQTICSGTMTFFSSNVTIPSGSAASTVTGTCTGLQSTDNIALDFNGSPLGLVGFAPSTNGTLLLYKWPTTNTINVAPVNNTLTPIVNPSTFTLNFHVYR